jgi:AraC family transcriptional regulator
MTVQDSRSEYARRMHRVLEHVDRHLDQPLDLDQLAGVAHFSAFHFHRVFSAWMGETLGDYVRRRRLETGALRLATQPNTTVLRVALSVGFNSAEVFTRAFRAHFGIAPTAWRRRERKNRQTKSNANQESSGESTQFERSPNRMLEARMNVKLIDRQPVHVAYLRHVGPYGEPISRFWQDVVYPWMVTNNLVGAPRFGVSHDDPSIAKSEKCRYDACVEVPEGFKGTGTYHETTIPGGRYAVSPFRGTVGEVVDAWAALLREWLPESGLQLDARPFFEYYAPNMKFDPKTGVFECELCIAVVPL